MERCICLNPISYVSKNKLPSSRTLVAKDQFHILPSLAIEEAPDVDMARRIWEASEEL